LKAVVGVTQQEISKQWDEVAKLRADQIEKGQDLSFDYILVPAILKLSAQSDFSAVIDIGCGLGFLTRQLASKAKCITGIDMSKKMINLAIEKCENVENIKFINSTVEDFTRKMKSTQFTLAVANMSLMTTLNLDRVLQSIACLLRPEAHFIFVITHPCFWPFYWGYAFENWFDYRKEVLIEGPFRISLDSSNEGLKTIHIHRPIERYIADLLRAGFIVDEVYEPMPTKDIEVKYPKPWIYPRFLSMRCIKKVI